MWQEYMPKKPKAYMKMPGSRISNAIMDSSLLKKVSRSGKNIPRFEPFNKILKKYPQLYIFVWY